MRDFLLAIEISDLVESIKTGTESAVETEHGILYKGRHRKEVKEVSEVAPNIGTSILPHALIIESVAICHLTRLLTPA